MEASRWIVYSSWGGLLFFGVVGLFVGKGISVFTSPVNKEETIYDYYQHPFLQTFFMFIGEFACLIFFYFQNIVSKPQKPDLTKKKFNPLMLGIPACLDVIGSTLLLYGYILVAASVITMMSTVQLIIGAILSVIFLGRKLYIHHVIGICIILLGLIIVIIAVQILSNDSSTTTLGLCLVVVSNIISPIQFVIEEKLFNIYEINALEGVGYEGLVGLTIMALLLPIYQNIPAKRIIQSKPFDHEQMPQKAVFPYHKVEDSIVGFIQISHSSGILIFVILYIITLGAFNFASQAVTKYVSSLSRITMNLARTALTWLISCLLRWETFNFYQLIGFIILTGGVIVYNEIYVPSICNLNYNTKENIKKRQELQIQNSEDKLLTNNTENKNENASQ